MIRCCHQSFSRVESKDWAGQTALTYLAHYASLSAAPMAVLRAKGAAPWAAM